MENIFEVSFKSFTVEQLSEAVKYVSVLNDACMDAAYRECDASTLNKFITSALAERIHPGYLAVIKDSGMPKDARVDFIYRPTYAILAAGIYLVETGMASPEVYDGISEMREVFRKDGIIGHGYEADGTRTYYSEMFRVLRRVIKQRG